MTTLALLAPATSATSYAANVAQWKKPTLSEEKWRITNTASSDFKMSESDNPKPSPMMSPNGKSKKKSAENSENTNGFDESTTKIKVENNSSEIPINSKAKSMSPRITSPKTSSSSANCSPISSSANHRTQSSLATPPHPSYSPHKRMTPNACFPPMVGGLGAIGGIGPLGFFNNPQALLPEGVRNLPGAAMPRNCSDLIRSMAAKYNKNSSNSPVSNLYQPTFPPSFPINQIPSSEANNFQSALSKEIQIKKLSEHHSPSEVPVSSIPPHLLASGAFPGLPNPAIMDFSSTQVLINMVRNASHLHHQQNSLGRTQKEELNQLNSRTVIQTENLANKDYHNRIQDERHSREDTYINSDKISLKRPIESSSPLDLSSSVPPKYARIEHNNNNNSVFRNDNSDINVEDERSSSPTELTTFHSDPVLRSPDSKSPDLPIKMISNHSEWSVDEVYEFVKSIDICAEYAKTFREQRIDGACLSLLSESHLTDSLKMKLGPALKLRSFLIDRVPAQNAVQCHPLLSPTNSCTHCTHNNNNSLNLNKNCRSDSPNSENVLTPPSRSSSALSSLASKCFSPTHAKENGSPNNVDNKVERQRSTSP